MKIDRRKTRIRKDVLAGMLVTRNKRGWLIPCNKNDNPMGIINVDLTILFTGRYFNKL